MKKKTLAQKKGQERKKKIPHIFKSLFVIRSLQSNTKNYITALHSRLFFF